MKWKDAIFNKAHLKLNNSFFIFVFSTISLPEKKPNQGRFEKCPKVYISLK